MTLLLVIINHPSTEPCFKPLSMYSNFLKHREIYMKLLIFAGFFFVGLLPTFSVSAKDTEKVETFVRMAESLKLSNPDIRLKMLRQIDKLRLNPSQMSNLQSYFVVAGFLAFTGQYCFDDSSDIIKYQSELSKLAITTPSDKMKILRASYNKGVSAGAEAECGRDAVISAFDKITALSVAIAKVKVSLFAPLSYLESVMNKYTQKVVPNHKSSDANTVVNRKRKIVQRCREQMAGYGAAIVKACVDQDLEAIRALSIYPAQYSSILNRCRAQMDEYGWVIVKSCVDQDIEAQKALDNY